MLESAQHAGGKSAQRAGGNKVVVGFNSREPLKVYRNETGDKGGPSTLQIVFIVIACLIPLVAGCIYLWTKQQASVEDAEAQEHYY